MAGADEAAGGSDGVVVGAGGTLAAAVGVAEGVSPVAAEGAAVVPALAALGVVLDEDAGAAAPSSPTADAVQPLTATSAPAVRSVVIQYLLPSNVVMPSL